MIIDPLQSQKKPPQLIETALLNQLEEKLPVNFTPANYFTGSELLTKAKRLLSGDQEITLIVPWPP